METLTSKTHSIKGVFVNAAAASADGVFGYCDFGCTDSNYNIHLGSLAALDELIEVLGRLRGELYSDCVTDKQPN